MNQNLKLIHINYTKRDLRLLKKPIIFSVLFFILILIKCYSLEDVGCEQKADKQLQLNTIAIGHDAPDFQVELLGSKLLKLSDHVKKIDTLKNFFLNSNFNFNRGAKLKILHISTFDERSYHRLFNISIPDYEELTNLYLKKWLYFASESPIWKERIDEENAILKKLVDKNLKR